MEFLLKIHEPGNNHVVALCDKELLGKKFSENDLTLDIDPDFFGGKPAAINEIKDAIQTAQSVNIAGNEIVSKLMQHKILSPSGVKIIDKIKYAHIYRV
ncbi:MAG: DUF424 family protein [archaeon]|nr:DUF424 family protein [archaeon]